MMWLEEPEEFARLAHFNVVSGEYIQLNKWALPGFIDSAHRNEVCLTIPVVAGQPLPGGLPAGHFTHDGMSNEHPVPQPPNGTWRCWYVRFNNVEMVCDVNSGPARSLR